MAFLTGERQFREIQLHDEHHVPSHPGRHVARKGRGTMDISCSVCDLQMHHFADIQYEKQIYSSTCLALVCIFNIFHLIFLRYIINNSSKTCPSINSEFLLPIFCHIPHLPHPSAMPQELKASFWLCDLGLAVDSQSWTSEVPIH